MIGERFVLNLLPNCPHEASSQVEWTVGQDQLDFARALKNVDPPATSDLL